MGFIICWVGSAMLCTRKGTLYKFTTPQNHDMPQTQAVTKAKKSKYIQTYPNISRPSPTIFDSNPMQTICYKSGPADARLLGKYMEILMGCLPPKKRKKRKPPPSSYPSTLPSTSQGLRPRTGRLPTSPAQSVSMRQRRKPCAGFVVEPTPESRRG